MRNLTYNQLALLAELASDVTLTQAAAELGLSQPAASMQLQRLESALGVPLLERWGRSVQLTERGRRLARHAREVVEARHALETQVDALVREDRGVLKVGCVVYGAGELMTAIFREFAARRPDVVVERIQTNLDNHLGGLAAGDVDVAFGFGPVDDARVAHLPLFEDPAYLAIADGSLLARRASIDIEEVLDLPILAASELESETNDFWLARGRRDGRPPRVAGVYGTVEMHLQAVAMSRGVSIVSYQTVLHYTWSGVVYVPLVGFPPVTHWVAWRRGQDTAAIRQMVNAAAAIRDGAETTRSRTRR